MCRIVLTGVLLATATAVAARPEAGGQTQGVRSWAYWLTEIDPSRIAASGYDLVVVDHSRDGSAAGSFSRRDVALMRRKPDGGNRLVLCYMSIGEAEDYRFYWNQAWKKSPPLWLAEENPEWKGNYKVRYWDPEWQRLVFGAPESYLDRILGMGFDGVYLDIIDAFEHFEPTRPTAAREMVDFVRRLSAYAKEKAGTSFLVFAQNGERLLEHADYMAAIDGIAKEDLFYGNEGEAEPSPPEEIDFSLRYLRSARAAGKCVLTVDYVSDPKKVTDAYTRSRRYGFVPYASVRALDRLVVNPGLDPTLGPSIPTLEGRRTPGQFFATTAPRGYFRLRASGDYWRERYPYSGEDPRGLTVAFEARRFFEGSGAVALTYGLTDRWEVGLQVPTVVSRFERDPSDTISGLPERDTERGLGNLRLLAAHGRSWNEESSNLLLEIEVGFPTDTRSESFRAAGDARLALTLEHYWERVGLIGTVAESYFGEDGFSGGAALFEYRLGVGLQLGKRLFASVQAGEDGEDARFELAAEVLLSGRASLEFSGGRDFHGPAEASFFGIGLNLWLGGGNPPTKRTTAEALTRSGLTRGLNRVLPATSPIAAGLASTKERAEGFELIARNARRAISAKP